MGGLVALLRGGMDGFKSILTSQDFGSEYELLCTQLSVQWMRIRLWGESVGINIEIDKSPNENVFQRPEVQATVNRSISTIAYLLTEIESLRQKYERKPHLETLPECHHDDTKSLAIPKSHTSLSALRTTSSLRQRIRDHQKQKSFFVIAKWAIYDARKFDNKVKQLKSLIDGLEDVTRAATFTRVPRPASTSTTGGETLPPYSELEQSSIQVIEVARQRLELARRNWVIPSSETSPSSHYQALKLFLLTGLPTVDEPPRIRPREKLERLSSPQLDELRTDIFDDLIRRQHHSLTIFSLPPNPFFHSKRNQAREKLSTLLPHRFRQLVSDMVSETERRLQVFEDQTGNASEQETGITKPIRPVPFSDSTRRYGCVLPHDTPPPALLRSRPLHRTTRHLSNILDASLTQIEQCAVHTLAVTPATSTFTSASSLTPTALPQPRFTSYKNPRASVEIFKSFRVSMEDPTAKVLPAALRKYNITAPSSQYSLYIVYGDKERKLGPDEKPLILFKQLDKEGWKPLFMLRKTVSKNLGSSEGSHDDGLLREAGGGTL